MVSPTDIKIKLITAISLGNIAIDNVEAINTHVAPVYPPLISWVRSIDSKYFSKKDLTFIELFLKYSIKNANKVIGTKKIRASSLVFR